MAWDGSPSSNFRLVSIDKERGANRPTAVGKHVYEWHVSDHHGLVWQKAGGEGGSCYWQEKKPTKPLYQNGSVKEKQEACHLCYLSVAPFYACQGSV